jgi:uracil-DNA glycosylase
MNKINEKISSEQICQKLIDKLSGSGWEDLLKGFLLSSDFQNIIQYLVDENEAGRRFTPVLKQAFRAFEECHLDKTKVVFIGQDPYPHPLSADGIAFSCGNLKKPEVSLKYMLNAVTNTVDFNDQDSVPEPDKFDLSRWSKQGILMLNSALTTQVSQVGKHTHIWKPFIEYLIDMLNFKQSGLIWVLLGKQAQSFEPLIGEHHVVFKTTHPAYAAYIRAPKWECDDIYNKVNQQLIEFKKDKILW